MLDWLEKTSIRSSDISINFGTILCSFRDNEFRDYCIFQNKTFLGNTTFLHLNLKPSEQYRPTGPLVIVNNVSITQ